MHKSTWFFIATTVIAITVAVYLWQHLISDRQVMARARDQIAQLELAQARKPAVGQQEKSENIAQSPAPSAEALHSSIAMANADQSVAMGAMAKQREELRKDTAFRESMLAQLRAQLPREYPDLGKALGLIYEQLDALLNLLAKQQMNPTGNPGEPERAIEAQLGSEKFQQFLEYRSTKTSRLQVEELRTALSSTAHPLTDYHKELLLDRMIAEQNLRGDEIRAKRPLLAGPGAGLATNEILLKSTEEGNQRVLEEARNYLNPEQVAALRSMMEQKLSASRASLRLERERLQDRTKQPTNAADADSATSR